jgi:hypothetical protein
MAINDERDDPRRDFDPNRDRQRSFGRERGPRPGYRDTPRGRTHSNISSVVRDVDRLAYSLTRASARAYFGTVGAIGDLVVNLADSLYAQPYGYEGRERYRDPARDPSRDPDRDSTRTPPRDRAGGYGDRPGGYEGGGHTLSSDVSGSLRQAIRDTADVWSDSVREFSQVFHDEQERDDEIDARVAAAEDEAVAARPERPRPRTRPAAPPEPPQDGNERP